MNQADAGHPTLGSGVVDPGFCQFARMCHDAGVPIVILSAGKTVALMVSNASSVVTTSSMTVAVPNIVHETVSFVNTQE